MMRLVFAALCAWGFFLAVGVGVVAAYFLLQGCAAPPAALPPPVTHVQCLPMPAYSKAEDAAFGDALAKLPPDNPLVRFITDAIELRRENKACQTSSKG